MRVVHYMPSIFRRYISMATARQLDSGRWRCDAYLGRDKNGKKLVKTFITDTRWEAEKLAFEYARDNKHKEPEFSVGDAVSGYIDLKRNILSPSTVNGYEIIRRNRLQSLMKLDVHEVNSLTMQKAINEDSLNVGAKTLNEAKNLVMTALKLYGIKPDVNVTLPAKKPVIKDLPEPGVVIEAIRGSVIELPCLISLWLSLRISEVRGLQFRDIKNGCVTVQRSLICFKGQDHLRDVNKTYNSTRVLELPEYLINMINEIPHEKETDFIVNISYQNLSRWFKNLLKKKGYNMHFHDLRHLNASVMLQLGIPDKYAMERGGWSTNSTLKKIYQHTFSEQRKLADKKIDDYFNSLITP